MSREGLTLINGSQVEILSQSHTAVRGTRVQKLRCDEVELFKPDVWEAAQFVTKSKQCGEVYVHGAIECLSTMHLPFGLMHKLVEECGAERRQLFKWGVVDVLEHCTDAYVCTTTNAAGFVENCKLLEECGGRAKGIAPPGGHFVIADAIAQKGRVCEAAWESEMMCVRPSRSDSVIPEFDPKIHVRAFTVRDDCIEWNAGTGIVERRRIMHWTGGMDFGGRSPTVMLWVALDDRNTLWVCDEHVKARWFFEDHMAVIDSGNAQRCSEDGLLAWPRPEYLAVDPAGKADSTTGDSGAVTLLTRRGYDVRAPSAHVKPGLALVRARFAPADLSPPRLFVHERCRHTIESLVLYHYKKEDIDGVTPVKDGNDHCVDALRYLVWSVDKNVAVVTSNYIRP